MLHLDCPTRWNSTYDMLDTAEKLQEAFNLYENKDCSYVHELSREIPSPTDWYCIKKLTQFLGIFKLKTEIVSSTSYVVANSFFNEVVDLHYQLDKVKTDRDMEFRVMVNAMKDKFDKYWGSIKKLNMLMYFAIVLDPRMKMPIVRYGFKRICDMKMYTRLEEESIEEFQIRVDHLKRKDVEDHVSFVDDAMKILYEEYRIMYEEGSSNMNSEKQGYAENMIDQENEFVEAFLKESDNSNVDSATELEKYKSEPREKMVKVFDILTWWKDHSPRFPILSKMAKDILAIPVSSVASESAFSTSGRVLDAFRSSLSPRKVEALICAQDWLRISRTAIDIDEYLDDVDTLTKGILESVKDNNCGTMED
ncbi:zinc finger BED domain-containing protein RICESLEEPER 2-like [Rutidosis leptorrhynchoides]|uniref:zinc finger BED domain-containing protein RICESLEEPER 2-like n=1 Tax=Rutidosis leptorrhynchoides TaxID=125765 RepID=UPI003A98E6F5